MRLVVSSLIVGLLVAETTQAVNLPPDRVVTYVIHETPQDPESPVKLTVTLRLSAEDAIGSEIGWYIAAVNFERPVGGSNPHSMWTAYHPLVNSADGLWWVTHADLTNPKANEFVHPPQISGLALSRYEADDDVDFELTGTFYNAVARGNPYPVTSGLTYALINSATQEPEEEGDDEPVEVPDST